jgi:hypothetical protein
MLILSWNQETQHFRYGGGESVMLCLYVDDILIFGSNLNVIEEVKNLLSVGVSRPGGP